MGMVGQESVTFEHTYFMDDPVIILNAIPLLVYVPSISPNRPVVPEIECGRQKKIGGRPIPFNVLNLFCGTPELDAV